MTLCMSKVDTLKLRLFEFLVAYDIDNMTTQSKIKCWKVSTCIFLTNWDWVERISYNFIDVMVLFSLLGALFVSKIIYDIFFICFQVCAKSFIS